MMKVWVAALVDIAQLFWWTSSLLAIVVLLWLYSGAPHPAIIRKKKGPARKFPLANGGNVPSPKIYLPWTLGRGYMNIRTIKENCWIEMDEEVFDLYPLIQERSRIPNVFLMEPEKMIVYDASLELLESIVAHLCSNFPGLVSMTSGVVRNHVTNQEWKVASRDQHWRALGSYEIHPLLIARFLVGDDLIIMSQEDDLHVLAAGALAFPDNWKLEEKLGLPLAAIHYPVNALNTKKETKAHHVYPSASPIIRSMETFFQNMYKDENAGQVFNRFSWAFQHHDEINNRFDDWISKIGDQLREWTLVLCGGDEVRELQWRSNVRRPLVWASNLYRVHILGFPPLELFLRTERQTLRLLPRSKCVVFTIRTRVNPISEAIDSVEKATVLKHAYLNDVAKYDNSGKGKYREEVLSWLARKFNV